MQPICEEIWDSKYRLKDTHGQPIDDSIDDTWRRVARALADVEQLPDTWYPKFLWALQNGAIPAGRIVSNAGARAHKPATSLINCTVSGAIDDSMDGIMTSLHEAALTLKAGCVAPGTQVFTDRGLTTADAAVEQGHQQILCYDRERGRFEMRAIERHLRVNVPRDENIEIRSNGTTLVTSIKHPVLVYRDGRLLYVRADEVCMEDGLVHHHFPWDAPMERTQEAWFAGAHLGDGSAYPKRIDYHPSRSAWRQRAEAAGQRLVFKIRAAGREVVERYAHFFQRFYDCQANVVQAVTPNNTPVWDFTVASFKASAASGLFDNQCGKKSHTLHIPAWIAAHPERHFLPFLAGIVDTDGTVSTERGSVIIATASQRFTAELANLLALFGVHAGITQSRPRSHDYRGKTIVDRGGWTVKISDSDFLRIVASYMADSGKKRRIHDHASQAGQYDRYRLPQSLRAALETEWDRLGHTERQQLGFYHGYHRATAVSRIWLDRWQARFPHLAELIDFARTLRPVEGIRRNLPIAATFYDFTVERHNNYLAGNGGMMVIHNCGIGYEFSTLRPRGAHVSGAGASTSGPLLFMDIFDAMCATVSSAGGRRGAQMGTFDVRHPDVVEFIKAKRTNGRLRKFNLSLLITDAFMRAVEEDGDWVLEFPGYSDVQKKLKARELWDLIMRSTYDYAEPGVLFIDQLNLLNNNWFCEDIRATNPCCAEGTYVATPQGYRKVETIAIGDPIITALGTVGYVERLEVHDSVPVYDVELSDGTVIRVTAAHIFHTKPVGVAIKKWDVHTRLSGLSTGAQVRISDATPGDTPTPAFMGMRERDKGFLIGVILGDGCFSPGTKALKISVGKDQPEWRDQLCDFLTTHGITYSVRTEETAYTISLLDGTRNALVEFGLRPALSINKELPEFFYVAPAEFLLGLVDGMISTDGNIHLAPNNPMVRISSRSPELLRGMKRIFNMLGIHARVYTTKKKDTCLDGRTIRFTGPVRTLCILGADLQKIARFGVTHYQRCARLKELVLQFQLTGGTRSATIKQITPAGTARVYDLYEPETDTWITDGGVVSRGCGEQPLPPYGACLLGSIDLTKFVEEPFTVSARFDLDRYKRVVAIFTRMLDNVVEIANLPLPKQREELRRKRRHGMGVTGLGSALALLGIRYGSPGACSFTEVVMRNMAEIGWRVGVELAKEKGPAPIMDELFEVTPAIIARFPSLAGESLHIGDEALGKHLFALGSYYLDQLRGDRPDLIQDLRIHGSRFTHHTSIAPTGTISLAFANNASNGIEPSFSHRYFRNLTKQGRKTREQVEVFSAEAHLWRELHGDEPFPKWFVTADEVTPKEHIDVQAAAQKWVDSSISKTINIPSDYPYEEFKEVYQYAYEQGLKGCATFRFNPEMQQGVLVKEKDLGNTQYRFTLADGSTVDARGNEEIEYEGETHSAANLFDAIKEGTYGRF